MIRLEEKFEYLIDKNTLTIKRCPNNTLDYNLLSRILNDNKIKKVIICEGVENVGFMSFFCCRTLKKIIFPNTLKIISSGAFSGCMKLKKIEIPSSVEIIESNAFKGCDNLRKINMPSSVKTIEVAAFSKCNKLKKVNIEEGVQSLCANVFSKCTSLKKIKLPSSICYLGEGVFEKCSNLRKINIPEGVESLDNCFNGCSKLKKVTLPTTLKKIFDTTFAYCTDLSKIILPDGLEEIGFGAFASSGIWEVNIPGSVKNIDVEAFKNCNYLFDVTLNEGLKNIDDGAFLGCVNLSEISIPDTVKNIGEEAFRLCANLRNVKLSKNSIAIKKDVFSSCYKLKKIEIPEGIEQIELGCFDKCFRLEEIHFPSTIKKVKVGELRDTIKLRKIFMECKDGKKEIDISTKKFINNDEGVFFFYDRKTENYSFYNEGEYVEFSKSKLTKNKKIKDLMEIYLEEKDYIKLYCWSNRKVIPSYSVINTMPIKDIDNFFINKNCNEWAKLIKESGITYCEYIVSFFKLCYVLGVFSESTTLRDNAVNFIRENIISKSTGIDIHDKFDGFDLSNGFNKDYAEFFMKYYNEDDFMIYVDEDGDKNDLIAASYNNYRQVKQVYPNRRLHSNRNADLLLPKHVMNAVRSIEYYNVDDGNEEFSYIVGRYGYNQEQFEILQEWYNKAKKIKKEEMKLFICDDEDKDGITYELLSKNDLRGAILGNITNCCQVIDGAGEECVEYGLIKPNSGFITFNYKNKIIGQAWVWYDEINKIVCLDNIEVPHRYLEKINENIEIQKKFC